MASPPSASLLARLVSATSAFRLLAVLITLGILAMCLYPHPPVQKAPDIPHLDKLVHAIAFLGHGFAVRGARLSRGRASAVGLGVAALTEALQAALPSLGRSGDLGDLAADAAGLFAGIFAFEALARRAPQGAPPSAPRELGV